MRRVNELLGKRARSSSGVYDAMDGVKMGEDTLLKARSCVFRGSSSFFFSLLARSLTRRAACSVARSLARRAASFVVEWRLVLSSFTAAAVENEWLMLPRRAIHLRCRLSECQSPMIYLAIQSILPSGSSSNQPGSQSATSDEGENSAACVPACLPECLTD